MNKNNAINIAKTKINGIEWYVPDYTPSNSKQAILSKQILSEIPTEPQCVERSIFMKEVNFQIFWIFESGTQGRINVPIWIVVGFQQKDRQDSQNINNDTFYRPPVTSGQCITGTE